MIPIVEGLTYGDLDIALKQIGYVVRETDKYRFYEHPQEEKATIPYPRVSLTEPLRAYHLTAARAIVDSFGLMDAKDFDLSLIRLTQDVPTTNIVSVAGHAVLTTAQS
jgi:hypothetical protein